MEQNAMGTYLIKRNKRGQFAKKGFTILMDGLAGMGVVALITLGALILL